MKLKLTKLLHSHDLSSNMECEKVVPTHYTASVICGQVNTITNIVKRQIYTVWRQVIFQFHSFYKLLTGHNL